MTSRDKFLMELRKHCRKNSLDFEVEKKRGKGSHYKLHLNGITTTIKSGELTPSYMRLIKKQLGLK